MSFRPRLPLPSPRAACRTQSRWTGAVAIASHYPLGAGGRRCLQTQSRPAHTPTHKHKKHKGPLHLASGIWLGPAFGLFATCYCLLSAGLAGYYLTSLAACCAFIRFIKRRTSRNQELRAGERRSLRLPVLIVTGEALCSIPTHPGCP
jgi:hypothetical protein